MKIKNIIRNTFLSLAGALAVNVAAAQQTVKGTIFDVGNNNKPLSGAMVMVEGTTTATVSDSRGNFTINVPSGESLLVVQTLGYETQKIRAGKSSHLEIFMEEASTMVEEVIVTALGITRQEKALGYSAQKIQGDVITQSVVSNWINNLGGKVAGLTLHSGGTGPGGQQRVTLRGDHSLNYSNNQALFVVDGVPILSGSTATTGGTNYASDAAVDFGDNISDLNAYDIESVSVLKGASASALYGSRASNGVILITTKRGRVEKGWGVTLNTSVSFESAMRHPDFQTEYGPSAVTTSLTNMQTSAWGLPGSMTESGEPIRKQISRYTYGLKFDPNVKRYLYHSKNWDTGEFTPVPWVYADDWFTGIFETGVIKNTSVSVQGNSGKGTSGRFSFTNKDLSWIMPNTGYKQQTYSMVLDQEVNRHISLFSNINYTRRTSDQMPMSGYNQTNPMYGLIWGYNAYPMANYHNEYFKGRYTPENYYLNANGYPWDVQSSLVYSHESSADGHNPFRTLYEELNTLERNRIYGNLGADIKIIKNLNLRLRSGLDMNNEFRTQRKPKISFDCWNGMYREQSITEYDINSDFLLTYKPEFCGKFSMTAGFGGNDRRWNKRNITLTAPQLDLDGPEMYKLANSAVQVVPSSNYLTKAVQSLYGYINVDWNDTYFLDVTARNDWSSTLKPQYWSYFYPSVSASILLDKALKINSPAINLLKLRIAWANVGNDTEPYRTVDLYGNTNFPGGFRMPDRRNDPYLRPERTESVEAGADIRLLSNRLSFDMALYQSRSYDHIITAQTSYETGISGLVVNGADIRNRGIELSAKGIPVRNKNVTWELFANWYKNKIILQEYIPGWDPEVPYPTSTGTTIGSRTFIYSYVGKEMYWIYGADYNRAPQGSFYTDDDGNMVDCSGALIVNPSTGRPSLTSPDKRIARADPKWRGGFGTTLRYKSLSMTANFAAQMGGHSFSVTNFALSYQGKLKNSLEGRPAGLVVDGVNATTDQATGAITYAKNQTITDNVFEYYAAVKWVRDNTYENTFSTDFLKFKELRIDYTLPAKWVQRTKVLQGASVAAFATNLFCISPWPQYDPEAANAINGSGDRGEIQVYRGIETGVFPMTRTFGFNVKLQF